MARKYHPTVKARLNRAERVVKCEKIQNPDGSDDWVCPRCEMSWQDEKPKCLTRREVGHMWITRMKQMFGGNNDGRK